MESLSSKKVVGFMVIFLQDKVAGKGRHLLVQRWESFVLLMDGNKEPIPAF
jgi:hypothetical protein